MATFVDTNVIVCAFDVGDERKRDVALQLLGDSSLHLVVSAQVLNEFSWTVTRRLEPPLEEEDAHDVVRHLAEGDVVPIDASLVDAAIALARRHRLAPWDAAILAAARRWGCDERPHQGWRPSPGGRRQAPSMLSRGRRPWSSRAG